MKTWTQLFSQDGDLFNAIMTGTDAAKTNALVHIQNIAGFVDNFNNLPDDLKQHIQNLIKGGVVPAQKKAAPKRSNSFTGYTLKDIINFKVNTTSVPVIEYAYLGVDGWLRRNNFECEISMKLSFNPKTSALIPIKILKTLAANEQIMDVKYDNITFKGKLITNKKSIDFTGMDVDLFPNMELDADEGYVFNMEKEVVEWAKTNSIFAGNDPLREVLNGVFFGEESMAATDAHRLTWKDIKTGFKKDAIIDKKYVKYLFEGDAMHVGNKLVVSNANSILIIKLTDGKYPNYKAVIPKENPTQVKFNREELLDKLKQLIGVSNGTTKQIALHIDLGKLFAGDLDFEQQLELDANFIEHQGETFSIGFNGSFMIDILKTITDDVVTFSMSAPNRAIVVNDNYLIMPVHLNKE